MEVHIWKLLSLKCLLKESHYGDYKFSKDGEIKNLVHSGEQRYKI